MIHLFRKTRKEQMEKQNSARYLKYALGEIILVVVGILIALQINNWNENQKNKRFEGEILNQIKTNLITDQHVLIEYARTGNQAVASIKKLLIQDNFDEQPDSIKFWLGHVICFDRFRPLTNAYEVLKSKGLDLISNKELRFLLGAYYDEKSKHVIQSCQDIETSFINEWLPLIKQTIVDQSFKNFVKLDNYETFRNGIGRRMLIINRDNWGGSTNEINRGIALIEEILTLIESELE